MLRINDDLLLTLERQHRQYAKGSKENDYSRAAHNVRNKESNERNNLRRRIERNNFRQHLEQHNQTMGGQLPLFPEYGAFQLTDAQRTALDYWKGTPNEVKI